MKLLLAASALSLLLGCSPVPKGELARVMGADGQGVYFGVLAEKMQEAKIGGYEYVGTLSARVIRPVINESLSCKRYVRISAGQHENDYVALGDKNKLSFNFVGNEIRLWINDSPWGIECKGVSEGDNLVVSIIFSYRPSSIWSDGDELDSLEIPLIMREASLPR